MPAKFDPPRYEWAASNAEEVLQVLRAATKLLEANMSSLYPSTESMMASTQRKVPAKLVMVLDLTDLTERVNHNNQLRFMEEAEGLNKSQAVVQAVKELEENDGGF